MNEKTLDRYLKVKALAEAGFLGEKEAAQRALGKMEKRYPGVEREAAALAQERAAAREASRPAHPAPRARSPRGEGRDWGQVFRYAGAVYETVREVVEEVADTYYGRMLAENEAVVSGSKNKGNLFIRVKIPVKTVQKARGLNGPQKAAFREAIQEEVENYLDAVLDG